MGNSFRHGTERKIIFTMKRNITRPNIHKKKRKIEMESEKKKISRLIKAVPVIRINLVKLASF